MKWLFFYLYGSMAILAAIWQIQLIGRTRHSRRSEQWVYEASRGSFFLCWGFVGMVCSLFCHDWWITDVAPIILALVMDTFIRSVLKKAVGLPMNEQMVSVVAFVSPLPEAMPVPPLAIVREERAVAQEAMVPTHAGTLGTLELAETAL